VPGRDTRSASVTGLDEVLRALDRLPGQAQREARAGAVKISRRLALLIRAAARASDRQSARAGRTVRTATNGLTPSVIAGPHPLLFGSNFGALGRFGWYSKHRYINNRARQFRAHRDAPDYWFFSTAEASNAELAQEYQDIADAIIRDWSA
jgi:hypothetical protein